MSKAYAVTTSQRKSLAVAVILALVFGAYFLREYVGLLIFAAILAFIFNPIYQRILRSNKNEGSASALTFIAALLIILIPLGAMLVITSLQINATVQSINTDIIPKDPSRLAQNLIDSVNGILATTPFSFRITQGWINSTAITVIQKLGTISLGILEKFLGSFISFFTTSIIFIFVFLSLLKNQKIINSAIRNLNPLGPEISDLYMARISAMTKAMVRGQFVIAIAQGFIDAALIYLGGVHDAFFVFFMILTILSFIPLGGGIVAIPIGVIMILTGNWIGGLIVIFGHFLIVTNIDNILRPKLVPAEAKLDSALTILSVFAGISLIGFLGIVIGPVIMIVIVTTIRVYLDVQRDQLKIQEA